MGEPQDTALKNTRGAHRVDFELETGVYRQMKKLAQGLMRAERAGHTLSPTDLVHEAFMKLDASASGCDDPHAYLFIFARQMRRLLVDYGRRKAAQRHGGELRRVTYTDGLGLLQEPTVDFVALNRAINALERMDSRSAQAVDLCYFTGASRAEAADALKISPATLKRDLHFAQSFIRAHVHEGVQ